MRWVVSVKPRPLYPPGKRPDTNCTGGWVGISAGLGGCVKSRPPQEFEPRTVQPVASRCTYDILSQNVSIKAVYLTNIYVLSYWAIFFWPLPLPFFFFPFEKNMIWAQWEVGIKHERLNNLLEHVKGKRLKQSRYRPQQAQRVPRS